LECQNVSRKAIVVYENGNRAADFLRGILRLCGRDSYVLSRPGEMLPPGVRPAVFLLCEPGEAPASENCPVCVTDYEFPVPSGFRQVVTYSMEQNGADFTVRNIRHTKEGLVAFEIVGFGIIGRVKLASDDLSDARAALASSTAAIGAGIPFADVLEALNHLDFGMNDG
jgi:hypothetical protein